MGKADLHVHSIYSPDSGSTVRAVLKQAQDAGLDVLAITDHDEMRGSLQARTLAPKYGLEAVPGVEVTTGEGHLVALYIEKLPPSGMPLVDTLLWIRDQGGLAIAAHPFTTLPQSLSMEAVLGALIHPVAKLALKGIEVNNMSTSAFNATVQKVANFLPLAPIASSDSHVYWTVGSAYTEFSGSTAADLRTALEICATTPVPYDGKFKGRHFLSWIRYMALRRFGFASDNISPGTPVTIQRVTRPILNNKKKTND